MNRLSKGYTVLEILIAVTILAMFLMGAFALQNDMLVSWKYGQFKSEQQRNATNTLRLLREDLEKACYPSKVFFDNVVIFGATEPQTSAVTDVDPGDNYKVQFRNGKSTGAATLLRFRMTNPIYDAAIRDRLTPESVRVAGKVTICTLELKDAGGGHGLDLFYTRLTTPVTDAMDTGVNGNVLLHFIEYVEIASRDVSPSAFDSNSDGNYNKLTETLPPWQKGGEISLRICQNSKYLGGWGFGRKVLGVTVETAGKAVSKVQALPSL
jgi:prepilin-type N-terminal cleavage/methylation domain-containing protein